MAVNLCDLELSNDFLNKTPKAQPTKEKKNMNFIMILSRA